MSANTQPQGSDPAEPNPLACGPAEPKPQDSCFKNLDLKPCVNNFCHHTCEMAMKNLIVRRGQGFDVVLTFVDVYELYVNTLTFTASTGDCPDEDRGTKSVFGIPDTDLLRSPKAKAVWKAEIKDLSVVEITITPPADAPVGEYTLSVKYLGEEKELGKLMLLFNPWCPADSVYMECEEERMEYVMNENGVIYRGSSYWISGLNWDFGQFEDDMMEIVLALLNESRAHRENPAEAEAARADPIYIGRVMSAMINCQDDNGVLEGNWSGEYSGGCSPSRWCGSHAILKKWLKSKYKPVKYGQCWVFAAVMCSVMRALGIPCRVVTNFSSAHDCDMNLIIDKYYAKDGVTELGSWDSVWNFHVWVECWMKRPDLPQGYDEWQVLDPTPQEMSEGLFQCGPSSVKAIRMGEVDLNYDAPFVFAEVNADVIHWKMKDGGAKEQMILYKDKVGKKISTKRVGKEERWDITDTYKPQEGSDEERAVVRYAKNKLNKSEPPEEEENKEEPKPEPPKVSVKFEEVPVVVKGQDVKLHLELRSEATESKQLSIKINVEAMTYTGSAHSNILSKKMEKTLPPGEELRIPVEVPFLKYWQPMRDRDDMKISAVVSNTKDDCEVYRTDIDMELQDPPIEIQMLTQARVNNPTELKIYFKNPVPLALKECMMTLSGSGLLRDEHNFGLPEIGPKGGVGVRVKFWPYKAGKKMFEVDFDNSVFRDIKACCPIEVQKYSFL